MSDWSNGPDESSNAPKGAASHAGDWRARILLGLAAVLLLLGLVLPVIRVDRFVFFSEEASLIGMAYQLFGDGDYLLSAVIVVFSIVFPAGKLVLLARILKRAPSRASRSLMHRVERLGRWSMLDVLVLALIVFSIKASGFATAVTQPGLYCFTGAVLLTMALSAKLRSRAPKGVPTTESAGVGREG